MLIYSVSAFLSGLIVICLLSVQVIDSLLHFMGRYQFTSKTPEHKSSTCVLYLANDLETGDAVAVKLMNSAEGLRQELQSRAGTGLDSAYVIDVLCRQA